MQSDFHYYAVHRLAHLAGYDRKNAEIIAYASQYVDRSTESEPVTVHGDQIFDTVRTAHYGLEAFDWNVQKKIYIPFHFLPKTCRTQSPKSFSYVTRPAEGKAGEPATLLFQDALEEGDQTYRLIRLGIALHTIADTFSHQGFSGREAPENRVGKIWHWVKKRDGARWVLRLIEAYGDIVAPSLGHLRAFKNPDRSWLTWKFEDSQKAVKPRDNLKIRMAAADRIFRFMLESLDHKPQALKSAHPEDYRQMLRLFKSKRSTPADWIDYTGLAEFDALEWRRQALLGDVSWDELSRRSMASRLGELRGKAGFDNSKWALFHRGAQKQRSLVTAWLN